MRGFRPSPVNVEESVRGALLGLLGPFGKDVVGCSTFGLEENNEDMICVCWRVLGLGCPCGGGTDVAGRSLDSFLGRFGCRLPSFASKRAFGCEAFRTRALRFSTLFDFSLVVVSTVHRPQNTPNTPISPSTTLFRRQPPCRRALFKCEIQYQIVVHLICACASTPSS